MVPVFGLHTRTEIETRLLLFSDITSSVRPSSSPLLSSQVEGSPLLNQAACRHHRNRSTQIIFHFEPLATYATSVLVPSRGLDESVLKSLPTFVYSSATGGKTLLIECAVYLSEFEDGEKGRLLPKCNHSFHIDCIDMWFQSHSTCPLCRTPVNSDIPVAAVPYNETQVEVAVTVVEPETGSSSGFCPMCRHGKYEIGCSSASSSSSSLPPLSSSETRRNKLEAMNFLIEVPRRSDTLRALEEEEMCLGSPGVVPSGLPQ